MATRRPAPASLDLFAFSSDEAEPTPPAPAPEPPDATARRVPDLAWLAATMAALPHAIREEFLRETRTWGRPDMPARYGRSLGTPVDGTWGLVQIDTRPDSSNPVLWGVFHGRGAPVRFTQP